MSVYFRYFRVSEGPLLDEILRLISARQESGKALTEFAESVGAELRVYERGGLAGFHFTSEPDQKAWRTKNREGLYLPRKSTSAGKALWQQIKALPDYPDLKEALRIAGLYINFPLLDGRNGYSPNWWGHPHKGVVFVRVPWRDIDPEELAAYRLDRAEGKRVSMALSHLLWEPPTYMQEIKEWQALKEYEELKADSAA